MPNGTDVRLYVKKPGSHTWVRLSTRETFSGHKWSYNYRLASRGTYYFKVVFAATSKYLGSTSKVLTVRSR